MTAYPFSLRKFCSTSLSCLLFVLMVFCHTGSFAHNGALAYAYPVAELKIDADLSDWPKNGNKYPIKTRSKTQNDADCSAFFQIGYNLKNQSLYLALDITDDDYVQDSSKNVAWNSQDGLEIYVDAWHTLQNAAVVSYLFTNNFKHINKNKFDPIGKNADWDKVEVVTRRVGNHIFYEWRLPLGQQLQVGRSLGIDFQVFDKDKDGSFSVAAWGKGDSKYRNPHSLGDVILMKTGEALGKISGTVAWDKATKEKLPEEVRLISNKSYALWVEVPLDTLGHYSATLPAGTYRVAMPNAFIYGKKDIYSSSNKTAIVASAKAGATATAATYVLPSTPVPDLIPIKGVLHDFDASKSKMVDQFIQTYQQYYQVPGVSLALIKDGKVVYYKTYGVQNSFTQVPLNENTLFEAASVTKPVFAYAVQRLMEKGIIDLDKPLYQYLPFKDIEHDERYKLITARHVLTHRTGFPNWRYMNADGKLDIKFTPGTAYNYSGEGFEYLKLVVEKITGKGVEQVLREELISPMGLYHMYFSQNDTLAKTAAIGHFDNLPSGDDLPEKPGMAYSMYTEAKAFTRFMLALLNQEGLKPTTYEQMLSVQSDYPLKKDEPQPKYKEYMGISLNIRETPYGLAFGHGGNNGDFRCQFELYKDLKMGYVLFTNASTAYPLIEALPKFLVDGNEK